MKAKNLFIILLVTIGAIQPITLQSAQPMSREAKLKALRILGYSAELLSSAFSYGAFQYIGWDRNLGKGIAPTLKIIKYFIIDEPNPAAVISCSVFQVPFLASMGHAIYGLYSEFKQSTP